MAVYINVYNITLCTEQNSTLGSFISGGAEAHISLQVKSTAKQALQDSYTQLSSQWIDTRVLSGHTSITELSQVRRVSTVRFISRGGALYNTVGNTK